MTRYWTAHWQNRLWRDDINPEYEPPDCTGAKSFRGRGVSVGDIVYVISLGDGQLFLGGRMRVEQIVPRDEAVRILGRDSIYYTDEFVIAEKQSGTPLKLHRALAPAVTCQLRFVSPTSEPKGLLFDSDTHLNVQTTRGIRELTPESAALLDRVIAITDRLPRSGQLITITDEMLHSDQVAEESIVEQFRLPEEIDGTASIREGASHQVTVNAYERDPAARRLCIAKHGTKCCICGFSFGATYGEAADGFIHVHHLRPLSEVGEECVVAPVMDLRPICPNCHAVVHRREPAYSLDEVREFLQAQKGSEKSE